VTGTPTIVLIGTLDTKGPEIAYVRDRVSALGGRPLVIDTGILGAPEGIVPDVSREDVAAAAGRRLAEVRAAGSRAAAVELMSAGLRQVCAGLWRRRQADGALCLGGAEGALLGAAAMGALPHGVPKLIVTPTASGRRRFGPFVGDTDVAVMHSVIDILGLNPMARAVFDNAAAAVVGMARNRATGVPAPAGPAGPPVGVTMLGNTTPGVMRLRSVLAREGFDPVVFHANGVGGVRMEKSAAAEGFAGVVDYTLAELSNTVMDGMLATTPDRLQITGSCGLPRVVVPGGVDFFNASVPLPARWSRRRHYHHNPTSILVRLSPDEMRTVARLVASRLNTSEGPLQVVVPTGGLSLNDVPGGRLWHPTADAAFVETLAATLRPDIPLEGVPTHVNDPAFADVVAERFLTMLRSRPGLRARPEVRQAVPALRS
jgi:uncharacterized protein (UPF0261 family)